MAQLTPPVIPLCDVPSIYFPLALQPFLPQLNTKAPVINYRTIADLITGALYLYKIRIDQRTSFS